MYLWLFALFSLCASYIASAQEDSFLAIAECTGNEGIPICINSLQDLKHFSSLQQLKFSHGGNERKAPLYSIQITNSNIQELAAIVAKGTWISYNISGIQFNLPIGVHGHFYSHYTFNIFAQSKESDTELETKASKMEKPLQSPIVKVNVVGSHLQDISIGKTLAVTYDLHWACMNDSVSSLFRGTRRSAWCYLLNSVSLLTVLLIVVAFIWIKNTTASGTGSSVFGIESQFFWDMQAGDNGWKSVYLDVFREPKLATCLASIVGIGLQTFVSLIVCSLAGIKKSELFFVVWCMCGFVNGAAISLILKSHDISHARNVIKGTSILQTILAILFYIVDFSLSTMVSSSLGTSLGKFLLGLAGLILINTPLSLFSTRFLERYLDEFSKFPCKPVGKERRLKGNGWLNLCYYVLPAGVLPFLSLAYEAVNIDANLSSSPLYYALLCLVTSGISSCSSIIATFALLNMEYYKWHWMSLICGGISGFYLYIFSLFLLFNNAYSLSLNAWLLFSFKSGLLCFFISLALASISYLSAQFFLKKLYSSIKFD